MKSSRLLVSQHPIAQKGFSLLEVMIALSILSIVIVLIWQAIAFGAKTKERINGFNVVQRDAHAVGVLRPLLRAATPSGVFDVEYDRTILLEDNALQFVTTGIHAEYWHGYSLVNLMRAPSEACEGRQALVLRWQKMPPSGVPNGAWDLGRVLVDCLDHLAIVAVGRDEIGERVRASRWEFEHMPERIDVLTSAHGRSSSVSLPISFAMHAR